jgi:hypothetical protein
MPVDFRAQFVDSAYLKRGSASFQLRLRVWGKPQQALPVDADPALPELKGGAASFQVCRIHELSAKVNGHCANAR